MEELIE
jgi:hypothetical protein